MSKWPTRPPGDILYHPNDTTSREYELWLKSTTAWRQNWPANLASFHAIYNVFMTAHMYARSSRAKLRYLPLSMPEALRALCPVRRGVITGIRALCRLSETQTQFH